MRKLVPFVYLTFVLLLHVPGAYAQKSTERYIPIGQSPGLSGKHTLIGKVQAVNPQDRTIICSHAGGTALVKVAHNTKIWLDRSKLKLPNVAGTLADCSTDRLIEVKYKNNVHKDGGEAEWIKVQVTEAGAK